MLSRSAVAGVSPEIRSWAARAEPGDRIPDAVCPPALTFPGATQVAVRVPQRKQSLPEKARESTQSGTKPPRGDGNGATSRPGRAAGGHREPAGRPDGAAGAGRLGRGKAESDVREEDCSPGEHRPEEGRRGAERARQGPVRASRHESAVTVTAGAGPMRGASRDGLADAAYIGLSSRPAH